MGDFLFKPGQIVNVFGNDGIKQMLIIGIRVADESGNIHDYAGVPYPNGYTNKIACFEHRDIVREKGAEMPWI